MSPSELQSAAIKLFGEAGWRSRLASALGVDRAQPGRWMQMATVPGPVAAAVECWLRRFDETGERPQTQKEPGHRPEGR